MAAKTKRISGTRARIAFFLLLAVAYTAVFLFLRSTSLYYPEGQHNDRLFSADDIYYVTEFFSSEPDDSLRIIKHPLLIVFGWGYTLLEQKVFGEITPRMHYEGIVILQTAVSLLSVFVLDRILSERYRLKTGQTLLCCAVYACSFSVLFYTFVAESYILSSLFLLLSFYFADKKGFVPSAVLTVLGMFCAGVTITNAALWALIVCFGSGGDERGAFSPKGLMRKFLILIVGGFLFCSAVAAFPQIRMIFYENLFTGAMNSAKNYSDRFPMWETVKRAFYIFFGSTLFPLDTQNASPFGDFEGSALSFLPSAEVFVTAAALCWAAALLAVIVVHRGDGLLCGPLAVLCANLLLHGVIRYGLKEGFLYSLHHLGAQLLILALPMGERTTRIGKGKKGGRTENVLMTIFFAGILVCELVSLMTAGRDIAAFLMK